MVRGSLDFISLVVRLAGWLGSIGNNKSKGESPLIIVDLKQINAERGRGGLIEYCRFRRCPMWRCCWFGSDAWKVHLGTSGPEWAAMLSVGRQIRQTQYSLWLAYVSDFIPQNTRMKWNKNWEDGFMVGCLGFISSSWMDKFRCLTYGTRTTSTQRFCFGGENQMRCSICGCCCWLSAVWLVDSSS